MSSARVSDPNITLATLDNITQTNNNVTVWYSGAKVHAGLIW